MKKQILAVTLLSTLGSTAAFAKDNVKPFTLEGGLGFIFTSGNTETTSVNASLVSHQELEDWSNDYNLEGLYKKETVENSDGEDEERTSAQKIFASAQGNYKLENPDYRLFGFASYSDDRFSGYNYQSTVAAGWNQKVWDNESTTLSYSIGPGYSWNETTATDTDPSEKQNSVIVRASGEFSWLISETAKFTQTMSTEVGADNTKSRAEAALTATISGNLSMKLSVRMDHNSQVNEGTEKLDTATAVTLVYNFF